MPNLLKLCLAVAVAMHPFAASAQTAAASVAAPALTAAQIEAAVVQYYKPDEPGAVVLVAQNGVRHGNVHMVPLHLDTPSVGTHQHRHFLPGS